MASADDVTDVIKERLKSPFYGSWAIAFAVINWRAAYILLFPSSDMGFLDRLNWVDGNLYPSFWHDHFPKLILLPLIVACVAVAGVPWLINVLDSASASAEVARQNKRIRIGGKLHSTLKEIDDLKAKIADLSSKLNTASFRQALFRDQVGKLVMSNPRFVSYMSFLYGASSKEVELMEPELNLLRALHLIENDKGRDGLTQEGRAVMKVIRELPQNAAPEGFRHMKEPGVE